MQKPESIQVRALAFGSHSQAHRSRRDYWYAVPSCNIVIPVAWIYQVSGYEDPQKTVLKLSGGPCEKLQLGVRKYIVTGQALLRTITLICGETNTSDVQTQKLQTHTDRCYRVAPGIAVTNYSIDSFSCTHHVSLSFGLTQQGSIHPNLITWGHVPYQSCYIQKSNPLLCLEVWLGSKRNVKTSPWQNPHLR
jgi:hypothetical protein